MSYIMLLKVLQIVQMVLAVLLIIAILLQQKGSGLGASMGGPGGGSIVSTRRGVDLFLYKATIILSIIFFGLGISFIIIK